MPTNVEFFSQRLKDLRIKKSLKQTEMATFLHITVTQYQRYEYGKSFPRFIDRIALADFFDVSLDYLVGREK